MEIGEPQRAYEVEPLADPVPAGEPARDTDEAVREPEAAELVVA